MFPSFEWENFGAVLGRYCVSNKTKDFIWILQLACTAPLLPELQPAPSFLSAISGQTD